MSMDGEARQVCVRSASLHARGDLDGAIAEIEQALQIDPRCAEHGTIEELYDTRGEMLAGQWQTSTGH